MNATHRYLQRVATDIDDHGIAAVEHDIRTLLDRARRLDVNPVAVSVLADPTQPEIARARAFAMVAASVARATEVPAAPASRPLVLA